MPRILLAIVIATSVSASALAQATRNRSYPAKIAGARVEVYKTIGDAKLNMYIFEPEGHKPSDKAPAIVFFFGGGWRSGSPTQFAQHCKYLASRGMVACTADYRVLNRHGTKAVKCVSDGKSAVRWIRKHAQRLGIDPNRIAAGGGSAGGHVAACTGTITGFDENGEDVNISSRPNALALFNPAVVLAPVEGVPLTRRRAASELKERMGVEPKEISPYHQVERGVPPTIIFHGKGDTTVPYKTVELFAAASKKAGNTCELVGFDGRKHGFFNYGRNKSEDYRECVRLLDKFLVKQGFLEGKATID